MGIRGLLNINRIFAGAHITVPFSFSSDSAHIILRKKRQDKCELYLMVKEMTTLLKPMPGYQKR